MKELKKLYNELGTLQWIGEDEGWDLAIEAVRNRISTIINKNKFKETKESLCSTYYQKRSIQP